MKLSGRLQLREWWREGEKDWIMALCARDGERTEISSRCQRICRGNLLWDGELRAAISLVLRSMNNHPQSLSARHHQPSLNFNTTSLLTDLLFFLSCSYEWMNWSLLPYSLYVKKPIYDTLAIVSHRAHCKKSFKLQEFLNLAFDKPSVVCFSCNRDSEMQQWAEPLDLIGIVFLMIM